MIAPQFKNGKPFETPLPIHRQSCYLFGRERRIADVPTDHPSCSKQQAVIQFRCALSTAVPKHLTGLCATTIRQVATAFLWRFFSYPCMLTGTWRIVPLLWSGG